MTAVAAVRRLVPLLLAAGVLAAAPTPTPAPRLSGGFGKAPAAGSAKASRAKGAVKITNQSLVTEPDKGNVSTSSARPGPTAAAPVTTPAAPGATAAPGPTTTPAPAGGEEYWRGEAARLRERVAALTEAIARLQNEVVKLEADFYSWDDGAYRDGVIKPAWDKAREELVTARRELPIAQKELADLPERARKAGAAPGWIRE